MSFCKADEITAMVLTAGWRNNLADVSDQVVKAKVQTNE